MYTISKRCTVDQAIIPTANYHFISTIYDFLVSREVLLKKVRNIENAVDNQEDNSGNEESAPGHSDELWYESVEYTRTLDKAYCFFKDGYLQAVRYHPWISQSDIVCVISVILPSMRKDRVYNVTIIIRESSARVVTAYCTCH